MGFDIMNSKPLSICNTNNFGLQSFKNRLHVDCQRAKLVIGLAEGNVLYTRQQTISTYCSMFL